MYRRHHNDRTSLERFGCRSILTRHVRSPISLSQLESFLCPRHYDSNIACGYVGLEGLKFDRVVFGTIVKEYR
jgi:hypothetical protein